MPNTYQYVNQQGTLSTVNANSSSEALANAQNIASDSGVQLLTNPIAPAPSQTPTINPVVATTPVSPTPPAITPQGLQNQTPVNVPSFTPVQAPILPNQAADALFNQTQVEDSALQQQANGISTAMADAIAKLTGQTQELATQQQLAGVGLKKQELQTLDSLIKQKQAEMAQSDVQLIANQRAEEERDTLLPFAQMGQAKLAGDAAILRALKSSEVGVLNAQVLAKQGDIALAQEAAQQAVDLKYAPYKEFIAVAEAQLKALEPLLSREEKKQAAKQQLRAEFALKEINQVSELQKTALSNAILNEAPLSVQQAINKATSVDEILKVAKDYLVSPKDKLELQKLRIDINKSQADYLKTISEINSARETIGGTTGDVTTDLILGSSAYSGKQPSATWIDDFTQAGVALGNVKELQSLIDKQGATGLVQGNIASLFGKFSNKFSNAAAINAQIQRTVPGLARGIFKEVGVLTEDDINNYKKTLPNLTSPEQQNKLALLATYDVIERSMALSLANQAKAKNDVSGYYQDYINVKNQVKQLKSELGFIESAPITQENKAKLEGGWNSTFGSQFTPQNITNSLNNLVNYNG